MSSPGANAQQYLATKVMTARPEELRLMLLDGAIRFARQGREGLGARNYEASFNGFSRCRDILFELMVTMKPQGNPELVSRLTSLYSYMISRLLQASTERDAVKADEVIGLLEYERETWSKLMDQLAAERAPTRPAAAAAVGTADPASSSLSLEG